MRIVGHPELGEDPRYADRRDRVQIVDELDAKIEAWTSQRPKQEALEILAGAGVPCGAVLDSTEVLKDKHLRQTGFIVDLEHPRRGRVPHARNPVRLSDSPRTSCAPLWVSTTPGGLPHKLLGYGEPEIRHSGATRHLIHGEFLRVPLKGRDDAGVPSLSRSGHPPGDAGLCQPAGTVTSPSTSRSPRALRSCRDGRRDHAFMVFYALHDALVSRCPRPQRARPGQSWTMSKYGRVWEFVLRKGARFHNFDPVTAEDVKFSFERYRGAAAPILKERVREVQVVDPGRVRFHLKDPWPDFMTFYGTSASGAAWIVPKK